MLEDVRDRTQNIQFEKFIAQFGSYFCHFWRKKLKSLKNIYCIFFPLRSGNFWARTFKYLMGNWA